eukprot:TRINITY_DN3273_c0_g1_i15.p1 TRINITY_DN3273_c0_g1~~TRINITY_DN3273_c0_g1_i15.p1  ORF type:complete len:488 (+),score=88.00 TRINITY_DN3273_c0_g1_i15:93-1556(+)
MDKMITTSTGEVIITNDGATILNKMELKHPAAKMLVDLAKAQDVEAGDGTTSVVVIAGALLRAANQLLSKGIHPSAISDAYLVAAEEAQKVLQSLAIPADLTDKQALVNSAITSLNSKVVSNNSAALAPIAVEAVLRIADLKNSDTVNLTDIKVVKKLGGTAEDTQLVEGIVFDQPASKAAGGPTKIKDAKIGLIQYCLSAPKTNMENNMIIDDYTKIDRMLKEERAYILKRLKPIIASGCNVLLIQKSILRDATNDLAMHYLAKKKIMVVRDVERTEIDFITATLGLLPVADPDVFEAKKLGQAELAEEISTPGGKIVKITGVKHPSKTVTILVRGSNRMMLDEAERSVHDALCCIRSLIKNRSLLPGGGAPEIELAIKLAQFADSVGGISGYCIKAFARALEVIPYTLAENAGLHPVAVVTELRRRHVAGEKTAGINVKKGRVSDILEENVVAPLLVSLSAIKLATETVRIILKIDDIVAVQRIW